MALMKAQRYPDDYAGIISGSNASRHIHKWNAGDERSIEFSRHPEEALTEEKADLVNQFLMSQCDTLYVASRIMTGRESTAGGHLLQPAVPGASFPKELVLRARLPVDEPVRPDLN